MKKMYSFIISLMVMSISIAQNITIDIIPTTTKSLDSISTLDRRKYFNICESGMGFEQQVNNPTLLSKYINEYDMSFGRLLTLVYNGTTYTKNVIADKSRPGYADLSYLQGNAKVEEWWRLPSAWFKNLFSPNLGALCHDNHNSYPPFMKKEVYPGTTDSIPVNKIAAAELAVNLLKYNFSDWSRPIAFEPINEPAWQLLDSTKMLSNLTDFHLKIWEAAKAKSLPTIVGGPCQSVCYFYRNNYQMWKDFAKFIDMTGGKLDFYSFHVYDFHDWDTIANRENGNITSGLPLEGILDLLSNYGKTKYNKNFKFLTTEHGGFFIDDVNTAKMSKYYLGNGSGFNYDMKVRSIIDFSMVSSAISNTMVFMNHPKTVIKTIPFILLQSYQWDSKFFASMLVANDFNDPNNWFETKLVSYYQFFKGVQGRYVHSSIVSPDIQKHVFVDNNKLIVVLNNLSDSIYNLNLNYPSSGIDSTITRSFTRNADATASFVQSKIQSASTINLKGREAKVIFIYYKNPINESKFVNESYYYSSLFAQQFSNSKDFTINVPTALTTQVEYAYLRIGVGRGLGTDRLIKVNFNGTNLVVPLEKCAPRLENISRSVYGSTKIIPVDKALIKSSNTVKVTFPDGKVGGTGSVTLCVANTPPNNINTVNLNSKAPFEINVSIDKSSRTIRTSFMLENEGPTSLKLYNSLGGEVKTICNDYLTSNFYTFNVDASRFSTGVYFLKFNQKDRSKSIKLML